MSEDLKNRLANSGKDGEEPMYQFFGDAPSLKRPNPQKNVDYGEDWSKRLDRMPLTKVGFITMHVLLVVAALVLGITKQYSGVAGALLTMAAFFVAYRKCSFTIPEEFSHYAGNLLVTLRGFIEQFTFMYRPLRNSNQVMAISILILFIEKVFLQWFLFAPLSEFLYVVGVLGLGGGVVCSIANGRIQEAYRGLIVTFFTYTTAVLMGVIFTQSLAFSLVYTMFILYVAALFLSKWLDYEMV